MLINKFTTGFSGEKVPRTLVVLKMAIQFRKKRNGMKAVMFNNFIENIPKTSKNAAHVVQHELSLKAPLYTVVFK